MHKKYDPTFYIDKHTGDNEKYTILTKRWETSPKRCALSLHKRWEVHKNAAMKAQTFKVDLEIFYLVHPSSMMILLNGTEKFCYPINHCFG